MQFRGLGLTPFGRVRVDQWNAVYGANEPRIRHQSQTECAHAPAGLLSPGARITYSVPTTGCSGFLDIELHSVESDAGPEEYGTLLKSETDHCPRNRSGFAGEINRAYNSCMTKLQQQA